jgi:YVTN family beta-propeller protein
MTASPRAGGGSERRGEAGRRAIAVTPDGKFAYVVNRESLAVLVVDTVTKMVVARVRLPEDAEGIAGPADGKHAYATGGKNPLCARYFDQ